MDPIDIVRLFREGKISPERLIHLLIREARDWDIIIKYVQELFGDELVAVIDSLSLSEAEKEALKAAIRAYNANLGKTPGQIAKRADAINKIKEIARKLPIDDFINLLKRLGILEVSFTGVAEAAGATLAAPLALLFGLWLGTRKLGEAHWDWGAYWRDPCADLLTEINDAYANQQADDHQFEGDPTRDNAKAAVISAGALITLCGKYRLKCPDCPDTLLVAIIRIEEDRLSKYLDWLRSN